MSGSLKVTKAQLVKRFSAILRHACDMDPLMVLEFCEDVRAALEPIENAALMDADQQVKEDADVAQE